MTKLVRSAKSTIIIAILLVSLFAVSASVKAGPFIRLNSNIDVSWGEKDFEKPVIPRDEVRRLNLTVKYKVDWGGDIARGALDAYVNSGKSALINLEVTDHSPWCSVNLESILVPVPLSTELKTSSVFLNLQLNEDAPAYGEGYVKIRASVGVMGLIGGFDKEFTLDFIAEYLPRISVSMPEGNTKEVSPTESAVFPIEVSNMGNARTTVFFKIDNIPEGWTVAVTDDVTLDEVGGSKEIAYLTVSPPKGFGYHYDEQSIIVTMTPARAEDLTNQGEPSYITVVVGSRGFSTPGFESVLFIGALLAVVVLLMMARRIKKK